MRRRSPRHHSALLRRHERLCHLRAGAAASGRPTFTLETWFKRTGAGAGTSTGSGGIASAIPLVTKGRAEAEGSNVDMNYFLGIDAADGTLVADFEDTASGANHPVSRADDR